MTDDVAAPGILDQITDFYRRLDDQTPRVERISVHPDGLDAFLALFPRAEPQPQYVADPLGSLLSVAVVTDPDVPLNVVRVRRGGEDHDYPIRPRDDGPVTDLPDLAALHRAVTPTAADATANLRAVFALQPSLPELRAASASLMVDRLREDLEAKLRTTWRGRIAWRLSCWYAQRRKEGNARADRQG